MIKLEYGWKLKLKDYFETHEKVGFTLRQALKYKLKL